jgi:pyruvate,water dikinase
LRSARPGRSADRHPALVELARAADAAERVGGKAAALGRAWVAGLPVPPGFVLAASALEESSRAAGILPVLERAARELLAGDGARAREAGEAAAQALRRVPIPDALRSALAASYQQLLAAPLLSGAADSGAPLFAVRSSAVGEDGALHSHAGQFETLLNLRGIDAIEDAIRAVWASWYGERAVRYRIQARREAEEAAGRGAAAALAAAVAAVPPMAVLVQRMLVPRASGILFTANPVRGRREEMLVEAGLGLGEALAQGRVHPDLFVVERSPQLRIVERGIGGKDGQLLPLPPGSGRLEFVPVDDARRRAPALSDGELLALCEMAQRVEAWTGGPVDVEWSIDGQGRIFLLQARPITALPGRRDERELPATIEEIRRRPVLWTQRFCGERWTEQATPLGWSLVQPVLHWFTHWEDASGRWLDGSEPTRLFRGRPYFNIAIFRHLAFALPGGAPPQFLLEMFPEDEQQELRAAAPYGPNLPLVGAIFGQVLRERRHLRYRWSLLHNHREWEEFRPRFERRIGQLPLEFAEPREGLRAIAEARSLLVEYLSIHLLSLLFAHLSWEAVGKALRGWLGPEGEAIRAALLADPDENLTLRTNRALWELAGLVRGRPALLAAFQGKAQGAEPPDLDTLRELPGGREVEAALDRFLAEFGHRSPASWEIFAPRWADSPELVLRLLQGQLAGGRHPEELAARRRAERAQAERLVRGRMARTFLRRALPWRQASFEFLLGLARRYMALRENQRFSFDFLLLRTKRLFERMGALLERDRLLAAGEDIVFLHADEVEALVQGHLGPDEAAERIARRRAEFEENRGSAHPDFLVGDDAAAGAGAVRGACGPARDLLSGLAISPGRVRGTVRVLHSLQDAAKLRPGEVLVARAADPGWTPLFLNASALVLELGSVLSHAAVVAREYRLPAVVNVQDATRLLRDGMSVTVDGDRGRVFVHRAAMDPAAMARELLETWTDA